MSEKESKIDWKLNSVRVNLRLPEEVYSEIKKHAQETWKSVSTVLSKGLWTYIKDKFIEEEKRKEVWDIIWNLSVEELENEVLKFIESNPIEFAYWTEARVYKMHIPWKKEDVLVVKRKYKDTSLDEYELHSKAKEVEILLKKEWIENNVHIPTLFHHFNKEGEEYILMEYIDWKTLYLMIIESILSNQTIKYWEKINDLDVKKEFYYIFYDLVKNKKIKDLSLEDFYKLELNDIYELLTDENWYFKEIDIESDISWENILKYLYWILDEQWILDVKVDSIMDMWWIEINKFLFDIVNNNDLSKIAIFSKLEWLYLSKNISNFLIKMHDNWLYHRDLWLNTRNIILKKTEDWFFRANIIDFWKSKVFDWVVNNKEAYFEENSDWSFTRYANDSMIVTNYIDKLTNKQVDKYRLIDKQKQSILEKIFDIWNKYNVDKSDLKFSFENIWRYKNTVYYENLIKILSSREIIWWFKLNLSQSKNKEVSKEREIDNSKVLSNIIVLMYFVRNVNLVKIIQYIKKIEKSKDFNIVRKKEYINLYKNILDDISRMRRS